jgi:hypothetical protein
MKLEMRESKVNSLRMMQERATKLACAHQETSFLRMKLEMCVSKVNSPQMMQERAVNRFHHNPTTPRPSTTHKPGSWHVRINSTRRGTAARWRPTPHAHCRCWFHCACAVALSRSALAFICNDSRHFAVNAFLSTR